MAHQAPAGGRMSGLCPPSCQGLRGARQQPCHHDRFLSVDSLASEPEDVKLFGGAGAAGRESARCFTSSQSGVVTKPPLLPPSAERSAERATPSLGAREALFSRFDPQGGKTVPRESSHELALPAAHAARLQMRRPFEAAGLVCLASSPCRFPPRTSLRASGYACRTNNHVLKSHYS